MITDGRTQGLRAAGFPVGCASPGVRDQVGATPVPATSNRACGSPAHGLPTPFTGGIRFLPPGLVGPGCDYGSIQVEQAALVRREVADDGQAEAAPALVTLAGPDFVDLSFAVGEYVARRRSDDASWPDRMLAIKDLGGDCWVCLDCKP